MKTHVAAFCLALLLSGTTLTLAKTIPAAAEAAPAVTERKPQEAQRVNSEAAGTPAAILPEGAEEPKQADRAKKSAGEPAAILVEAAEEPKQADRAKKSATTTFCVEIRPGPSDAPTKVCDDNHQHPPPPPHQHSEPQIPQIHQEIHHHDLPPPPPPPQSPPQQSYVEHEQFYIVPPNPLAVFIPNEQPSFGPCGPNFVSHNTQIQVPGASQHFLIPSQQAPSQHFLIPSQPAPSQHVLIPSAPAPAQHIVVPSYASTAVNPCAPYQTPSGGLHPHALISLFRSAMAPNDPAAMTDGMEMRSGNAENWIGGTDPQNGRMDEPDRMLGSDSLDSPFARTLKKLQPVSVGSYYGSGAAGYQPKTPYIVQCNPQVLALGNGGAGASTLVLNSGRYRDAAEGSAMGNGENEGGNNEPTMAMGEPQNLGTPQGGRHLIQPIIHTIPGTSYHGNPSVFQHSTTFQTYQSQFDPMHSPSAHHGYSGYSVHPHSSILAPAVSPYYVRERGPIHSAKTWNYQPASMQRTSSSDMAMQQMQQQQQMQQSQQPQHQFQEKSWNQQTANMERTSSGMNMQQLQPQRSQQPSSLTPSQMLNQMRGSGGSGGAGGAARSGFERTSPIIMQSFPREHDDKPCKDGVHVNMHIPPGSQPFVISGPRHGRDEKNAETRHGGAMHDEMGKRETEKSGPSEKDD